MIRYSEIVMDMEEEKTAYVMDPDKHRALEECTTILESSFL